MIRVSLKEMLRTPWKTLGFLILLIGAAVMMMVGLTLWSISYKNTEVLEESFDTVGFVRQRADHVETEALYDAQSKTYRYRNRAAYDEYVSVDALKNIDAEYVAQPEKRPYYAAYHPGLKVFDESMDAYIRANILIAEVIPQESTRADRAVRVKIRRVLYGDGKAGDEILVCDHTNDTAGYLLKEKNYIMSLQIGGFAHDGSGSVIYDESGENQCFEYHITDLLKTGQCTATGERIADGFASTEKWDEVTKDFYNTKRGKIWITIGEILHRDAHTFPVIPTNSTNLLTAFYHGTAFIAEGRDISEAEYEQGAAVCIIRDDLAMRNRLKVGDRLRLPLYYADYEVSPGERYPEKSGGGYQINFIDGLLNAQGNPYDVFMEAEYEIVGIFRTIGGGAEVALGRNAVVIPWRSVAESDENSIAAYGPMTLESTSFSIPNGTLQEFQAVFDKAQIENTELFLYDKGYSELKSGMDVMKRIAFVFLFAGIGASGSALMFFSYLFIRGQRRRTAIERALGLKKRQCIVSLLSGIILIVVIAAILGCTIGNAVSEKIARETLKENIARYDMEYSAWMSESKTDMDYSADAKTTALALLLMPVICMPISYVMMRRNLKDDPITLLKKE